MRAKLYTLAFLIAVCGICEYGFYKISTPSTGHKRSSLNPHVLPRAVGNFQSTRRWEGKFAVGASYRDPRGIEASLSVRFGAQSPHNGIACWLVQGYSMLQQRAVEVRTTSGFVRFDTALFRADSGLALLANTECYANGCRENLVPTSFGLQMPAFSRPIAPVVPVSILVKDPGNFPAEDSADHSALLVQAFKRFVGCLSFRTLFAGEPLGER